MEDRPWLLTRRADFWVVSAGGGALLVVLALVLLWWGDRELSATDIVLGELHLGATYEAVVRRQLWRRMPFDVLAIPLAILVATYVLLLNDGALVVTTAILAMGAWHRGRQSLGIARYYQRRAGVAVSSLHRWLLSLAFYLPMVAGVVYYMSTADTHEGEPFHGFAIDLEVLWGLGGIAVISVALYLLYTLGASAVIHPGERWLVLANALGFGSAYVLGAWTTSLILVLVIHHEVQYLHFTYAVARQADATRAPGVAGEVRGLARFARWPVIGLASYAMCKVSGLSILEPFLTAGLLGHYWLDGRIWTARARRLAP